MTENPNTYQVGGRHYKTSYEHWDLVLDTGMGYLEGQATKYLSRWRKKNGLQDLEKALHYVDKLLQWPEKATVARGNVAKVIQHDCLARFFEANDIPFPEQEIFELLASWRHGGHLTDARIGIEAVIGMVKQDQEAKPVPAEDSNKHGERA